MRPRWPRRRPRPARPFTVGGAITVDRLPVVDVRHTVEHKPYPRPWSAVMVFTDAAGQQYFRYPVHVRGGSESERVRIPPPYYGDLSQVTIHLTWDYGS